MVTESVRPVTADDLEREDRSKDPDSEWGCIAGLVVFTATLGWAGYSSQVWQWVVLAAVFGAAVPGLLVLQFVSGRNHSRSLAESRAERVKDRLPVRVLSAHAERAWIVPCSRDGDAYDPIILIDCGDGDCLTLCGSDYDGERYRSVRGPWLSETNPLPIGREVQIVLDQVARSRYSVVFLGEPLHPTDLRKSMPPVAWPGRHASQVRSRVENLLPALASLFQDPTASGTK
jgi:hypothetical protein